MTLVETIVDAPAVVVDHSRRKRMLLIALVVWSVIYGIVSGLMPVGQGRLIILFFVNGVAMTGMLGNWTLLDIAERQFKTMRHFKLLLFVAPGPVVMTPVYFFQSRSRKEAWPAFWRAFGYYFAVQVALTAAISLVVRYTWG